MSLLERETAPVGGPFRALVLESAHRLLEARLADPRDHRTWVTSAEIAGDLDESRADVVAMLMRLGNEGQLDVRSTHVGLDMQVTAVRITG